MRTIAALLTLCFLLRAPVAGAEPEISIADFEGPSYGDWKAEGEAFGPGPARGTLPNQMEVSGFEGKGLVNSYTKGDGTTGTLTSPPFQIARKHINFLIGGGGHEGKTCMNLLVDGKVARTAVGPNTEPGGSEALDWNSWDVSDLVGKTAVIQIVDQATGGWGHINIDQIVQSDRKMGSVTAIRDLLVDKPWLHLPVKSGAPKRLMRFVAGGVKVRQFEIELAEGKADFWMCTEVGEFQGKTLRIEVDRLRSDSTALDSLLLSDRRPDPDGTYREALRPQFHFSPARGWTNDPNGLVWHDGEYHLFFQHNPYGTSWGNMTWGHAVSPDLVHWKELPDALHPDDLGTVFSGSAVVDEGNTAGWQTGARKVIVCIYTSAGGTSAESKGRPFTQSVAYSNDRGRTWTKYAKNPVLGHVAGSNRDPKVFWHEPARRWIMALFLDGEEYALFSSPDLKEWGRLCGIPPLGAGECPDFFELPVDGDPKNTRWVFWAGNGNYHVGRFDGKTFAKENGPHASRYGAHDYAAQTYSDIPPSDGRRIQISWMSGGQYPGMPFNQQMTVPRVLTLRTTPEGIRLFMEPVKEIEKLRGKSRAWKDLALGETPTALEAPSDDRPDIDCLDMEATFEPGAAKAVGLNIRGQKVEYLPAEKRLVALGKDAPLELGSGRIRLRILVDRTSVEVFANQGRVQLASCFLPSPENKSVTAYSAGGTAKAVALSVWELRSIWRGE